jgi:predicted phage-related endonuclease
MTNKKEWLLSRKNTLSASSIAPVVLGFAEKLFEAKILQAEDVLLMKGQPCYSSLYSTWLQMQMDDETYLEYQASISNNFTKRGQKLEEEIKNTFLQLRPEVAELEIKEQIQEIREINDQNGNIIGRISATLDYKIGEEIVLECKSTNDFTFNKNYKGEPYFGWILQLQMQMMLTGAKKGFLAILVGKDEAEKFTQTDFKVFEYEVDKKLQEAILYSSYFFFTEFKTEAPKKAGLKKEEEIEAFLRKKQAAVKLEATKENKLTEILLRKKELQDEIETVKKYLAEIEIEDKEINEQLTKQAQINKAFGGCILIYHDGRQVAKLEHKKESDSFYTEEDLTKIVIGAVKRKGALKTFFTFTDGEPKVKKPKAKAIEGEQIEARA